MEKDTKITILVFSIIFGIVLLLFIMIAIEHSYIIDEMTEFCNEKGMEFSSKSIGSTSGRCFRTHDGVVDYHTIVNINDNYYLKGGSY